MPRRVQLSRARGWRMPANTVKVDRSTIWGNPFRAPPLTREESIRRYQPYALARLAAEPDWLAPLRSKNLACWCGPGPCHSEILLKLANAGAARPRRTAKAAGRARATRHRRPSRPRR